MLASFLRTKGWTVLGIIRASVTAKYSANDLLALDLLDEQQVRGVVQAFKPDHIYHLAACHHSSEQIGITKADREMVRINFQAAEILAAAVLALRPTCRILFAGSSQMYTAPATGRLLVDEDTLERPATFYGYTKAWSRGLLTHYREHRGVFGVNCILFNHESPLRLPRYVTRKVSMAAAAAATGRPVDLAIHNIAAEVDWSDARDIVDGMYRAMLANAPADYVLASGQTRTVEELLNVAFDFVKSDWRDLVTVQRTSSAGALVGNVTRASSLLGWSPAFSFAETVQGMVKHDIELCSSRAGISTP